MKYFINQSEWVLTKAEDIYNAEADDFTYGMLTLVWIVLEERTICFVYPVLLILLCVCVRVCLSISQCVCVCVSECVGLLASCSFQK